ncbi:MAG TPA: peptidoglycan-binding domain-containing protein [Candidatus Paceibacterota bacterium]
MMNKIIKYASLLFISFLMFPLISYALTPSSFDWHYFNFDNCKSIGYGRIRSGDCIKALQHFLQDQNFLTTDQIDGKFGPNTRKALINAQKYHDLTSDGVAGKKTFSKINSLKTIGNLSWNLITDSRLAGFSSNISEVALNTTSELPCSRPFPENFLRREGGMCSRAYALKYSNGEIIDTLAKLKSLAPVTTETEAMSFVAAVAADLKMKTDDILEGYTATHPEDNFFVKVIFKNTFGCGTHENYERIYKVVRTGETTLISNTIIPGTGRNDALLCVD